MHSLSKEGRQVSVSKKASGNEKVKELLPMESNEKSTGTGQR